MKLDAKVHLVDAMDMIPFVASQIAIFKDKTNLPLMVEFSNTINPNEIVAMTDNVTASGASMVDAAFRKWEGTYTVFGDQKVRVDFEIRNNEK